MNYFITDIPNSGENPKIFFEIGINNISLGRIKIKLFRETFPEGVENFVKIASGETRNITQDGIFDYIYVNSRKRTFTDNIFYKTKYNEYIISGDIYNNDGSNSGTIYYDVPFTLNVESIPYYLDTSYKGLVVLIPFYDENNIPYYDSTFIITLSEYNNIDPNAVVIGEIYEGLDILDKINSYLVPVAAKIHPVIKILDSGILHEHNKNKHILNYLKNKSMM